MRQNSAILWAVIGGIWAGTAQAADYVVHISVDGLRPDGVSNQTAAQLPNFYRLRAEGAFTDNARTDVTYTITLPNHTSMLTGRPVSGAIGHNYTDNDDPPAGQTIHSVKTSYVASAFDVAHDNGLRTGMYTSKSKFSLYDTSYDVDAAALQGGAPDTTGPVDNGRDKIDSYFYSSSSTTAVATWASAMAANPFRYSFIHIHNPDTAGHDSTWDVTEPPTSAYMDAVRAVDVRLGTILAAIEGNPTLNGRTAIILSADHGGTLGTTSHSTTSSSQNYTIPFYVWGAGVTPGNLYALNAGVRLDPGTSQPAYAAPSQPIRNGDGGNLALDLLGLGAIPGSTINSTQNLIVPEPSAISVLSLGAVALLRRRLRNGLQR
jgi:hypothetical protein